MGSQRVTFYPYKHIKQYLTYSHNLWSEIFLVVLSVLRGDISKEGVTVTSVVVVVPVDSLSIRVSTEELTEEWIGALLISTVTIVQVSTIDEWREWIVIAGCGWLVIKAEGDGTTSVLTINSTILRELLVVRVGVEVDVAVAQTLSIRSKEWDLTEVYEVVTNRGVQRIGATEDILVDL